MLPSIVGVLIFSVAPFIDVISRSFQSSIKGRWVGLSNYYTIYNNDAFRLALKNTIFFLAICVPLLCILSLLFSCWIESFPRLCNLLKIAFLIPMVLPVSSVVLFCDLVFDERGALNQIVESMGIAGVDWLNSSYAMTALVSVYIWKNIGYTIILWCAALENIPNELYEASSLDGANKIHNFFYITLPNIATSSFIITVLSILNAFKVFRESYLIAGNYPYKGIYMTQNIFNNWFADLAINKISAGAVTIAVFAGCVIFILERAWQKREI